ncbi:hypothetical protein FB567DRAFT_545736 [Paraphoma chrysanthemicola]|uniref:Uncharacterized protein n=1 Tax=Paraphoma chrysanthemicola TaxID=798071 RepID=A0A8K0REF1_9PLEO|nr:hypothetical protein FB567DRAFT_545736 [Paraphoma chrysanthemicola]
MLTQPQTSIPSAQPPKMSSVKENKTLKVLAPAKHTTHTHKLPLPSNATPPKPLPNQHNTIKMSSTNTNPSSSSPFSFTPPYTPFRRPIPVIRAALADKRRQLGRACDVLLARSRDGFLGGRRRDARGMAGKTVERFLREKEELKKESKRAREFDVLVGMWVDGAERWTGEEGMWDGREEWQKPVEEESDESDEEQSVFETNSLQHHTTTINTCTNAFAAHVIVLYFSSCQKGMWSLFLRLIITVIN